MPAHIGAALATPHCLIHVFIILAAENRDISGLEAVIVPEESLYKCDPQVRVTWGGGGMSFQRVRVQGGLGSLDIFHFIYYENMKILMCIAKSDKHFSSVAESKLFIFDSCSRFFFILVPFWLRLQSYIASLKCTISNNTYKKNLGLHLYLW